uniref:PD-(D/E)XK nuclease family transposase n=1 Tax=Candidatus Kentrum sp. LPFa TaxID=2126335 RepID=A0A450WS33_9GAMM|nr:MAG: PD-(D/E)XK nuclease family transposase [Candidatus Kentron sp. LPFa]
MSKRRLITFDWALKRLLRSKANYDVLEGFLSELLKEDITIIEILERALHEPSLARQNKAPPCATRFCTSCKSPIIVISHLASQIDHILQNTNFALLARLRLRPMNHNIALVKSR